MRLSYYEILGIAKNADPETIKHALQKASEIWNPSNALNWTTDYKTVDTIFNLIQAAHKILMNESERRLYNCDLSTLSLSEKEAEQDHLLFLKWQTLQLEYKISLNRPKDFTQNVQSQIGVARAQTQLLEKQFEYFAMTYETLQVKNKKLMTDITVLQAVIASLALRQADQASSETILPTPSTEDKTQIVECDNSIIPDNIAAPLIEARRADLIQRFRSQMNFSSLQLQLCENQFTELTTAYSALQMKNSELMNQFTSLRNFALLLLQTMHKSPSLNNLFCDNEALAADPNSSSEGKAPKLKPLKLQVIYKIMDHSYVSNIPLFCEIKLRFESKNAADEFRSQLNVFFDKKFTRNKKLPPFIMSRDNYSDDNILKIQSTINSKFYCLLQKSSDEQTGELFLKKLAEYVDIENIPQEYRWAPRNLEITAEDLAAEYENLKITVSKP